MTHEIKIFPKYFRRVLDGSKTFEIRKNDRDYQAGDYVLLLEYCPELKAQTRNKLLRKIGYVLRLDGFGAEEAVAFSLLPMPLKTKGKK